MFSDSGRGVPKENDRAKEKNMRLKKLKFSRHETWAMIENKLTCENWVRSFMEL
jgi:hypothetical protein